MREELGTYNAMIAEGSGEVERGYATDHPARRGEHRRDDGGLGQAALRRARADQQPHRGRGRGHQPRDVRHYVPRQICTVGWKQTEQMFLSYKIKTDRINSA